MALEAMVSHDLLSFNAKDMYSLGGGVSPWGGWDIACFIDETKSPPYFENWKDSCSIYAELGFDDWNLNTSTQTVHDLESPATMAATSQKEHTTSATTASSRKRKRRRTVSLKNKEEAENQRMTHIVVERNRRKQMNEYLALLRSLMPPIYAQKGDQASIVGGAINYVKELEQLLQFLEVRKQFRTQEERRAQDANANITPLASFISLPQYSLGNPDAASPAGADAVPVKLSAVAEIEVTMSENHANMKILCRRRPKLLLKLVVGLQNLRLAALHLNVTSFDVMALYTFTLKVEDDCKLTTVDDIATAVHRIVRRIHEEENGFYAFC